MTFLLIGGLGLIGTALAVKLAKFGRRVVIVDNFRSSRDLDEWRRPAYEYRTRNATAVAEIVRADIRDTVTMQALITEYQPDVVYYLAALLASESAAHPDEAHAVQVEGLLSTIHFLEQGRKNYSLIFASSSYVYGNFRTFPAAESHPLRPIDTYGRLKLQAEGIIRDFAWNKGRWIILRPSSVYGVGDPRKRYATVAIEQAATGRPVELTYPDFVCDFTYVADVADAFALAGCERFLPFECFNVTFGEAHTNAEFINLLQEAVPEMQIVVLEHDIVTAPIRGALDSSRARRLLAWKPRSDIRAGIRDALKQANEAYGNAGTSVNVST